MTALHTAYHAGIWDSLLAADEAALPLPNALHGGICQKSAAGALETLSLEIPSGSSSRAQTGAHAALRAIKALSGSEDEIPCLGRHWPAAMAPGREGRTWSVCETAECLTWAMRREARR